jgi:hypothetical protein
METKISHKLHRVIGDIINEKMFPACKILKDPACGGRHIIPLFCSRKTSNATEYCNVDLLMLVSDTVKVIIEIEESGVKPTQIFGKFIASALSRCYFHKSDSKNPISMGDSVLFIQILDTSDFKEGSSKILQWKNIETSIRAIISLRGSRIIDYQHIYGSPEDFLFNKEKQKALIEHIKEFIRR